ncbi:MAG: hypothetical protein HYY31_02065 [Chloroflexi bacterium]|nr:hypothetical protein [Chloroflexota bacterium]
MHALMVFLLLFWGVSGAVALIVARDRLSLDAARQKPPSLGDEALARGIAFLAAGLALASVGLIATLVTTKGEVMRMVPYLWALCITPLLLPPLRTPLVGFRLTSQAIVVLSMLLTVASGAAIALFLLIRLLLLEPTIW